MSMARMVSYARAAGVALLQIATAARESVRKIAALAVVILVAPVFSANPEAALAAGPQDSVHSFYQTLLGAMKDGRTLGQSGRFERIDPVVRRLFDIPSMTRVAVGGTWNTLSAAQQEQVTVAFASYISASYAERFDSYSGQQLEVTGQQPSGSGIMVRTRITKTSGEPVGIDYRLRQNDGVWQIADVYLDGAISQLATQRSEFGAILRRDGFDGLLATLSRKVNLLTGTIAKAS